jgi:hypothetical protein
VLSSGFPFDIFEKKFQTFFEQKSGGAEGTKMKCPGGAAKQTLHKKENDYSFIPLKSSRQRRYSGYT